MLPFRQMPIAVFDHHDRRIDQHADRQCQAAQRHDVGTDLEIIHGYERGQDGERQSEDRDQRGAKVKQEDDDHQADDDCLLEQVAFEGVDRRFDQARAVVTRHDFDPRWKAFPDLGNFRFDPIDNVQRVLAVAHDDDAAHRFAFAVPIRNAFSQIGTQRHDAQIPHQHGSAIAGCNGDLFDVSQGSDIPDSSHQIVGTCHFKYPPPYLIVARPDFVDDGLQRYAQREQAIWVQLDLILTNKTADGRDFRDARHSLERVAHLPVLKTSQIGQVEFMTAVNQQILIHPTRSGGVRPMTGWTPAGSWPASCCMYSSTRLRAQ